MAPESGFTLQEAKTFVRNHFEEFVNRRNISIGLVNFSPDFVDHGARRTRGHGARPRSAMEYVGKALSRFADLHVTIEDIVAEGDKVVVPNLWTGTDTVRQKRICFRGIVIWRIADRQLAERWAFLESPREC